jgi:hypothetical protein
VSSRGTAPLKPKPGLNGPPACFSPGPVTQKFRFETAEEFYAKALHWMRYASLVLDVDADDLKKRVSYGNLILFVHAGRAFVRLLEHHESVPRDPVLERRPESLASFVEETGEMFQVPFHDTISKAQALEVLRFWLITLGRTPELRWETLGLNI